MVLADNSLTVQHAHIHVYEWDDDDDEDAAEGRELPEPVIESVPLRPSTAIDFSRPPLRPRTSGDFSLPVHQRPAPCSTSSTGCVALPAIPRPIHRRGGLGVCGTGARVGRERHVPAERPLGPLG